jgi:hypothetical protein
MCAMPKGYLTNINIKNEKIGPDRRLEILENIVDKGAYLPKGVLEEDMDETFIEYMNDANGLSISVEGEKVPVIFLTIQRWSEFTKTWSFTDKYKNIKMPFITVVRRPDIQQGQNQAGLWNIPVSRTYTFMKVPTWDGIRRGIDLYKIPQPTSVDLTYEVRLFTGKMKELNRFNRKVQREFQSKQSYINVNGHPMPLVLESIGDESNIEDFENRRFYVQLFEIKLLGYILDEEDFEVVPTLNRSILTTELIEEKFNEGLGVLKSTKRGNVVRFAFVFEPNTRSNFRFVTEYGAVFTKVTNLENIKDFTITVNDIQVFFGTIITTPLAFNVNDTIKIKINKINQNLIGAFKIIGSTK